MAGDDALERARGAVTRVEELEQTARDRNAWTREVERITADLERARKDLDRAVAEEEKASAEARSSRGLLGAVRDRLAGNLPEGREERLAQKEAMLALTTAKRVAAEALVRRLEGELEEARRKVLASEGALGHLGNARLAERKAFTVLTEDPELGRLAKDLAALERKCDAWRSAQRAAISRRDHTQAALEQLIAFKQAWRELRESPGDVMRGEAGPPPPGAIDHLKRARHELYSGARAGVAGLQQGVLADLTAIAAHEIDKPANISRIAGMLTRAIDDLGPIAEAAAKTLSDLEHNLSTTDEACERLRQEIHERLKPHRR